MIISKEESSALNSLRFLCIITLVFHHTQVDHLAPDVELSSLLRNVHQVLSLPFLPILFFLSGYLFFYSRHENQTSIPVSLWLSTTYVQKTKKRIKSLLIPYIIWSIISIIYVSTIKHTEIKIHSPWDIIILLWDTGNGSPIGLALWYIRNLLVFAILSPVYFIVVKYLKHITLFLLLMLQALKIPVDFPYFNEYLLLGSYLSLMEISVEKATSYFNWKLCLLGYIICKISPFLFDIPQVNGFVVISLGIILLMGLLMKKPIPYKYTVASTFIYLMHPYLTGIRNIFIKYGDSSSIVQDILIWFATALTVLLICYGAFYFLKQFAPKLLSVVSGGRV